MALSNDTRVVITGMGALTPVGIGIENFWQGLLSGKNGIGPLTQFDCEGYATRIAAQVNDFNSDDFIDAREARRMDRYTQFAVAAADMAAKDSGLDFEKEDGTRMGASIGSGTGGTSTWESQHTVLMEKGPNRVSPLFVPMMICNMGAGQISIRFGLKGPVTTVVTACATGSHSIGDAFHMIKRGDADVMFAGGAEAAITPLSIAGFCSAKAMSTRNDDPAHASRPFDVDRDGFVMGEGAGILVLESLEHAIKRNAKIYAEVVGYGATGDAYNIVATAPSGEGGARAMATAIKWAGIDPSEVDYVNAHGTSTDIGDIAETAAIRTALGEHATKVMVSSTKSMTGHMLGAAGACESIVCAMALKEGIIPPTINLENQDPKCDLDYVPNVARKAEIRYAQNNSFGFGGHNASLLFKRYEE